VLPKSEIELRLIDAQHDRHHVGQYVKSEFVLAVDCVRNCVFELHHSIAQKLNVETGNKSRRNNLRNGA